MQEKDNQPKMASTIWSVDWMAAGKSSVKEMSRSSSCLASRWDAGQQQPRGSWPMAAKTEKRGAAWDILPLQAYGSNITTHLVKLVVASLRIVDGWVVTVVEEMTCSHKPIAT